MNEPPGPGETSGFKLGTRDLPVRSDSHINIESCTRFSLVELERDTTNNRVRHICLRQNPGKRSESRTLCAFHLTS
jgi:hypothetical protein